MAYRSAFPMLICDDLARSIAFYCDALGFTVAYRFPEDGDPVYVAVELTDGSKLGLGQVAPDGKGVHGLPQRPATGHHFELCVYHDDVDAAVADLERRGHPVLQRPNDTPWGERIAFVADPDGNPVMITASAGEG
ncbi:glyoxalase/bleomycin resistance/dioxygenase family protein [Saccharothrix sp. ALI-22-I]|uniref:VOC family protein n=1 Tax=Saccharothrix sp. ALI-22-I TaxID=1933778 RepID=UPI00097BB784|nr:VOC family protein [Saccharothrix sp. ALI-22-I]ONI86150.1 glyoxalase/bleomycin resistance/dioxygenase family protein [Saccharothrix sp. ALI-22-I]